MIARLRRHLQAAKRGQSLLEMTMILPVFLLLVLGTLEFGMAFDHNLTLEYASREGVRTGSALAHGNSQVPCANVDDYIVAAVERVLASDGSPIDLTQVTQIRIYKVDATNTTGNEASSTPVKVNRWIYAPGQGPVINGQPLDFKKDAALQQWDACTRNNGAGADSIGVSLNYTYNFQTPLGALLSMVKIDMHDQSVMSLNPTGA